MEDANTVQTESDSSSDVQLTPVVDDSGLIGTVEFEQVQPPVEEEPEQPEQPDTSDGAEQSTPEDPPAKQDFHEHPRFQELIQSNRELKAQIDALKTQRTQQPEQPKFKNIMAMSEEELFAGLNENPRDFLVNFATQLKTELDQERAMETQEHTRQATLNQMAEGFERFFTEHPEAKEQWEQGELKTIMDQNPHHNAISAFYEKNFNSMVQAREEAARKDEREKVMSELKAKGRVAPAAKVPGSPTPNPRMSPELKDPDKFGGTESVLLKRYLERQAS